MIRDREIEMKFIAPRRPPFSALGSHLESHGLEVDWKKPRRQRDIYWDTPDYRMLQEGLTLRTRYTTEEAIATLKSPIECKEGLFDRGELSWPLSREEVALIRNRRIWPLGLPTNTSLPLSVSSATLQRVLTLHTLRHEAAIRGKGSFQALLAIDSTSFVHGRCRARHHEVEIELKSGRKTELRRIGDLLRQQFHLSPSTQSKFAIGMELVGQRP